MAIPAKALRRALVSKFGFTRTEGGNHEKYRLEVDGVYLAHTQMSRGGGDIGDSLLGMMARQLGVTRLQLIEMVECTIDRESYIGLIR